MRYIHWVLLCGLLLVGCTGNLLSQKPLKKPDPGAYKQADYVILREKKRIEIQPWKGTMHIDSHVHIWLGTPKACDLFETVKLVYPKGGYIEAFQAKLTRPDGTEYHAENSIDFPSADFNSPITYDDNRIKALLLEKVVPGSILEYRYRIVTKLPASGYQEILQKQDVPVREAQLEVSMPTSFPLLHQVRAGFRAPASKVTFHKKVFPTTKKTLLVWRTKELAPIQIERQMPHTRLSQLRISLAFGHYSFGRFKGKGLSWSALGQFYERILAGRIQSSPEITALVSSLTRRARSDVAKIGALYNFARRQIQYLAVGLDLGGLQPQTNSETLRFRYGDCKAKATLLISMLRTIGMKALPVLVRTRDEGPISPSFSTLSFNHMIVYVPSFRGGMYLDPTTLNNQMRQLRWDNQGASGLIVDGARSRLITLPSTTAAENLFQRHVVIERHADGSVFGNVRWKQKGASRIEEDGLLERGGLKTPKQRMHWLEEAHPSWLSNLFSQLQYTSVSPLQADGKGALVNKAAFRVVGKYPSLWLPLRALQSDHFSSYRSFRKYHPIFLHHRQMWEDIVTFQGWQVLDWPKKPLRFKSPHFAYNLQCTQSAKTLTCRIHFAVKSLVVPLKAIHQLQHWMAKAQVDLQRLIVLK